MFVSVKLALDVARHGNVEGPFVIIPFELDSAVQVARPVFDEFVLFGQSWENIRMKLVKNIFRRENI